MTDIETLNEEIESMRRAFIVAYELNREPLNPVLTGGAAERGPPIPLHEWNDGIEYLGKIGAIPAER